MATFKAGQRVRIARPPKPEDKAPPERTAKNNGCFTGVLIRSLDFFDNVFLSPGDWWMRLENGIEGYVYSYMLEPIQPEGNQVVAWSECAWKPPHMREVA